MTDTFLETAYNVISNSTGIDRAELTPETRFSQLNLDMVEFHEIYENACAEQNVDLGPIIDTMPVYSYKVGDYVRSSLRNLAAFSAAAKRCLERVDANVDDETIESFSQTLRQGKYVSSGQYRDTENPPRSKTYVFVYSAAIVVASVLIPIGFALLPCNPLCSDCTKSVWFQVMEMLPYTAGVAALILMLAFVPGYYALYREKNRRIDRHVQR